MMYPAAFIFKEASTAYVVLIVVNLFLGVTFTVTVFILQLFPDDPVLQHSFLISIITTVSFIIGEQLSDVGVIPTLKIVFNFMSENVQILDMVNAVYHDKPLIFTKAIAKTVSSHIVGFLQVIKSLFSFSN